MLEPEVPLIAPHRPRHDERVAVRLRRPADPVAEGELARAVLLVVVPDDPLAALPAVTLEILRADLPGIVGRAERGAAARPVGALDPVSQGDVRHLDALLQRDVAVRAREAPGVLEREALGDEQARIGLHVDGHVGALHVVRLRIAGRRPLAGLHEGGSGDERGGEDRPDDEPANDGAHQSETVGVAVASIGALKNSFGPNPNALATKFDGIRWIFVRYVSTVSLYTRRAIWI